MAPDDPKLEQLRAAINASDDKLLEILNQRARLVEEVTTHKEKTGGAFYVPGRERAIIDRLQTANPGPFPNSALRPVFQEIISACLSLETGVRIAYLGPEATFTHQAVKRQFGTSAITVPCGSIGAVFAEVAKGQADHGVVPVENSTEGMVNHTLDSFIESDLHISAEIVVNVEHCLLALPGTSEAQVERIYSHPQALAQCRQWITINAPRATLVECPSTTDAARRAQSDPSGAAIAAELAARLYRLEVLRRALQDVEHNVTRFLVVSAAEPAGPVPGAEYKTSLVLSMPDQAGFLFKALRPFSDAGINLTKIESRPSRRQVWDYVFFLDLDGHYKDEKIAPIFESLAKECDLFRILGSYRKADNV